MYNTGTVTTTANSTKVTGTNTKWKDNNSRVSAEQVILILNGTTAYINNIQSIQSDTELTLSFPAPVAVKNGTYNILTTMVNSVSDAANKIVAMNVANVQFSDIVNRLATETGVIEVVLPDGTKKSMKTFAEMDKQLDGKFDKAGGAITRNGAALTLKNIADGNNHYLQFQNADGKRRAFVGFGSDMNKNFSIVNDDVGVNLTIREGGATISGIEVLKVGDYGVGTVKGWEAGNQPASSFVSYSDSNLAKQHGWPGNGCGIQSVYAGDRRLQLHSNTVGVLYNRFSMTTGADTTSVWYEIYSTKNTTKDAQGNLRAASPIVKVFADHIETNDESEGVTLEKMGVGRYKLKGVLGMNSDASWGGFNGGIVIPKGIHGLELVWADYKVLADGDIILETHYRKHADLPPPVVLNRLIAYPEFMDENGNELESYTPCDIPNGHWIDIRVQMPSNSIYNQKQAEAERLAKIEAERLAQEEAKRAAEEAERAEQEAAERKQYGLDDNSVLL